jgi:outer membrane protein TolC
MDGVSTIQNGLRLVLPVLIPTLSCCSADHHRRAADDEVRGIVDEKESGLFGRASGFTIEAAQDALRSQLLYELEQLRAQRRERILDEVLPEEPAGAPEAGEPERDDGAASAEDAARARASTAAVAARLEARLQDVEARHGRDLVPFEVTAPPLLPRKVISLAASLEIASDNSRTYQDQKEQVYLTALDLTFQRYLFESRFGVTSSYDWSSFEDGTGGRQRDGSLATRFSLTQMLASGGVVVFDFTNSLLQRFTGIEFGNGTNHSTSSAVDLSFSQPLLRGFGREIVTEPLVQAEREAAYRLRDFERFRQEFAVSIASEYYGLLQQLDQIGNARRTYLQFIDSREQSEALAERGRRSRIQLDQATQSELNARNSWIVAQRGYQDALDRFKITLGLPIEADLGLDPADLERLRAAGLPAVKPGEEELIALAIERRLDHLNEIERLDDRGRKVRVAEDDLRAALDLDASVSADTSRDTVLDTQAGHATWRAGLALDLPVDRLAERNSYRAALIRLEAQERAVSLSEDRVKQQVRDALRRLAQLRDSFRIAVESVEVAERRVQSTAITLRMGRIEIRDALEATDDANRARNSLTAAYVDYEIARLELARDAGLLSLGPDRIEVEGPLADAGGEAGAPKGP